MANETTSKPTDLIIGSAQFPVRFSYAHLFEPKVKTDKQGNPVLDKNGKPKALYSVQLLIPKGDPNVKAAIDKAVRAALDAKIPGKAVPTTWKLPLRDGDAEWEEKGEVVKGHWFINCSSARKPDLIGTGKHTEETVAQWELDNANETDAYKRVNRPKVGKFIRLESGEFKSGDYGRVQVNFYYFEMESKGIAVGINNLQKLADGEALGGGIDADEAFGDLEDGFND